jgi:YggT family protein
MLIYFKYLVNVIIALSSIVVFLDTLLSYFVSEQNGFRRFMGKILKPIYQPIRRFIPPLAGIDFTPLIAIILLQVVDAILIALLSLIGSSL